MNAVKADELNHKDFSVTNAAKDLNQLILAVRKEEEVGTGSMMSVDVCVDRQDGGARVQLRHHVGAALPSTLPQRRGQDCARGWVATHHPPLARGPSPPARAGVVGMKAFYFNNFAEGSQFAGERFMERCVKEGGACAERWGLLSRRAPPVSTLSLTPACV